MEKVIIAGCRTFTNYPRLHTICDQLLPDQVELVSGGARGADKLGEAYARQKELPLKLFPADWDQYGNQAGPIRNAQMVAYADRAIIFWDGRSRGTKDLIRKMRAANKPFRVVQI